ncbi:hypothetical protein C5167_031170 [Papaver somniferum]|nr:hypothetical protein C5167_031170 [Papaver somniferum]
MSNWAKDSKKWLPEMNIVVYIGNRSSRVVRHVMHVYNGMVGFPMHQSDYVKKLSSAWSIFLSHWALLHCLDPVKFKQRMTFLRRTRTRAVLMNLRYLANLHKELRRHILQRVIKDVEKSLSPKFEREQRSGNQAKVPDIEKFLDKVATLQAKKGTDEGLISRFQSFGRHNFTGPHRGVRLHMSMVESRCRAGIHKLRGSFIENLHINNSAFFFSSTAGPVYRVILCRPSALVQENLDNANTSIEVLIADLQFLRDQVTIIQVTVTRVYSWDVHRRRMKQVTATAVTDLQRLSIIAWLFLSYPSQVINIDVLIFVEHNSHVVMSYYLAVGTGSPAFGGPGFGLQLLMQMHTASVVTLAPFQSPIPQQAFPLQLSSGSVGQVPVSQPQVQQTASVAPQLMPPNLQQGVFGPLWFSSAAATIASASTSVALSASTEKLGQLKTRLRELEDELVKALAVKTDREAKRLDLNDSVLAAKARIEELKRIVQIKTAKEEEYGAIISRQSMGEIFSFNQFGSIPIFLLHSGIFRLNIFFYHLQAIEAQEEKVTDHKESKEDAVSWYNKVLGFRIEGGRGVKFIFNNIDTEHPHEEYSFIVRHEDNTYTLLDCHPFVEDTKDLVQELNRTNGLFKFVRIMREKFQAAVSIGYPDQATSVHPEAATVSVSAPTSSVSANGSESRNEQNQLPGQPGALVIRNKKVKRVGVEKSQILSPASASSHRRSPRYPSTSLLKITVFCGSLELTNEGMKQSVVRPSVRGNQELISDFKVSEGIKSRVRIESDSTCLWLRADVVLEYTSEEVRLLRICISTIVFFSLVVLQDQYTGAVAPGHCHNWDVHRRRMKQVTATAVTDLGRLSIIAWLFLSYPSQGCCFIKYQLQRMLRGPLELYTIYILGGPMLAEKATGVGAGAIVAAAENHEAQRHLVSSLEASAVEQQRQSAAPEAGKLALDLPSQMKAATGMCLI